MLFRQVQVVFRGLLRLLVEGVKDYRSLPRRARIRASQSPALSRRPLNDCRVAVAACNIKVQYNKVKSRRRRIRASARLRDGWCTPNAPHFRKLRLTHAGDAESRSHRRDRQRGENAGHTTILVPVPPGSPGKPPRADVYFASNVSVTVAFGLGIGGAPDAYVFPSAGAGGDPDAMHLRTVLCPITVCSAISKYAPYVA